MTKGKLYIKSQDGSQFVKECTEIEYIELAIEMPGQYYFIPNPQERLTIQDLSLSIDRSKREIQKNIPQTQKSILTKLAEIFSIIVAITGIITFLIWLINLFK